MNNISFSDLDDFTKRLLPLTVLRRNAGEVLAKLPKVGTFILTKDGRPVAQLSVLPEKTSSRVKTEDNLRKLEKVIGGFRLGIGMTPKQMNKLLDKRYEEMLPR